MAAIVKAAARLPIRLVRAPVNFVLLLAGIRQRRNYSISVAGLDESKAQPLWFALRRAATSRQEQTVADQWLQALQVCQVASSLLLRELDEVEANLEFWHRREQRGSHAAFTLLRRGPIHFVGRLLVVLRIRRPAAHTLDEGDLVEKRVLIFRLLRSALCEALAQVQAAAGMLYLQQQAAEAAGTAAAAPQLGDSGGGGIAAAAVAAGMGLEEGLFQRADRMVTASLAAVGAAFLQLDHSVHATLDAQQGPAAPPAADWQVLHGAVSRVLGLHHLRRVFSRQQLAQLQQEPAAAAADAAAVAAEGEEEGVDAALVAAVPAPQAPLTAAAALVQARAAVGFTLELPANASVHSALQAAHRCARGMHRRRLVQVPHWALMPSEVQQHWILYSAIGLATGYGTHFLYRHSRLSGSRDLDNWVLSCVEAVQGAWREHVVRPLALVKDELFNTFRRRPTIVGMADYEADRDSLQRMLEDFQRDFVAKRGEAAATAGALATTRTRRTHQSNATTTTASSAAAEGDTAAAVAAAPAGASEDSRQLAGMDLVMRTYERELQKPLRNAVAGELVRALLIQVQKLKVDTASAMLEMDQILKANELSISLLAAVPAFLIAGTCVYYLGRLVTPTPPDARREALPVRLAMIEVERALEHVAATEEAAVAAAAAAGGGLGAEAEAAAAAGGQVVEPEAAAAAREQQGVFAYRLAVAYEEARELFRRHRGLITLAGGSEWPNIRSDLLELARPATVASRMRTTQRMMRSYSVMIAAAPAS